MVKRYLDYQSVDSAKGRCHEIHYCYDKSNRLVEVSDSTGAEETYTYDKGGRLRYRRSRIAEGVEQETGYKYDKADRITEIWERWRKRQERPTEAITVKRSIHMMPMEM